MSSPAKYTESGRDQQTIHEAINSHQIYEPIRGIHPRVELPDKAYEAWLEGNRDVSYVVINFSDASGIIERDGDLSQVLEPWHIPIILGTEEDATVNRRGLQDILDLLSIVQPVIYVPDVVYNYQDMETVDPDRAVEAYLYHVSDLQEMVLERDLNVRLIPTNKGWLFEHFERYQELFDRFDYSEFAFYAVQYTGGDAGNATRVLRRHITHAIAALNLNDVFVVGRLSREDLLRFDPRVRAATGLRQWKDYCLTEHGLSQDLFSEWQKTRETALAANNSQQQSYIATFSDQVEV